MIGAEWFFRTRINFTVIRGLCLRQMVAHLEELDYVIEVTLFVDNIMTTTPTIEVVLPVLDSAKGTGNQPAGMRVVSTVQHILEDNGTVWIFLSGTQCDTCTSHHVAIDFHVHEDVFVN